ncbi:VOC family protein [Oceanobacillus sp. CAU 1775]
MVKQWGFSYLFCNDLEKMKAFYSDILQLELTRDNEDSIAYKIGDHQLSISYNKEFNPPSSKFSIQPGWEGGTVPRTSWSLECEKGDFKIVVDNLLKNDMPKYFIEPVWKGYWSFPVLDPMNNTIEITCTEENIYF